MVTKINGQCNMIKDVKNQNRGIPLDEQIYVTLHNKIPNTKGKRTYIDLDNPKQKLPRNTNAIAIQMNKTNYICIDFDGFSQSDDKQQQKQEKHATANQVHDNFIKLLNKETKKYRIDKTASDKRHVWLKHPNIEIKEQLQLPKFTTMDGVDAPGIVEIFNNIQDHLVHLAGSRIDDGNNVSSYENIYAGADFNHLDDVSNIIGLLTTAILESGFLIKIERVHTERNVKRYTYIDATHNGEIRETKHDGKLHFSYYIQENKIEKVYVTENLTIDDVEKNCILEYQSIMKSIYYYKQQDPKSVDKEVEQQQLKSEISDGIVDLFKRYWNNTRGQRHYLILATSHVLVNNFRFAETDLENFYDKLESNVEIDNVHKPIIKEGLKNKKGYGIPKIFEILQCENQDLEFLAKYDKQLMPHELEHLERIHPTIDENIQNQENLFQEMYKLQQENYFNGSNSYITITPTKSITDLITQTIGNTLLKENTNIARLLLDFITAITGNGRTFIIVSGVSSGGKSALVNAVKLAIPKRYLEDVDDLSPRAFIRYVQNKGEYVYDRILLDVGDKGNQEGFYKNKQQMELYQDLITKGMHTYNVTKQSDQQTFGTEKIRAITDGFAQITTTTKDVTSYYDAQLLTRSNILYTANNSYNEISEFQAELEYPNIVEQVKKISNIIQSHILFNLNKYGNIGNIIVNQWKSYIKDLLVLNDGVNREINYTMKAFTSYCWLEIDRLEQVTGNDEVTYYIPTSAILDEFVNIYGVKTNKISDTDILLIEWLKKQYVALDEFIDDETDLDKPSNRKDANVFIFKDIELQLKADNKPLYKRINNISDALRKLEKQDVLSTIATKVNKQYVIYYVNDGYKEFKKLPIKDKHIEYAIKELKYHEKISKKNDMIDNNSIFEKEPNKFSQDIDFSFIDKRPKPGNIQHDDNNNDSDNHNNTVHDPKSQQDTKTTSPGKDVQIDDNTTTNELVNLHCHTDESVGDGAISIETLVDTAIQNNQKAIALTNHGTLNGLYKFNKVCRQAGIKAILGIEAYIKKERHHLILLAKNYQGYQDLLKLHNKNVEFMKDHNLKRNDTYVNGGIYYSNLEQEKELCKNLICLSGCLSGEIPKLLLDGKYDDAKNLAIKYNTLFNQFYLEIQYNGLPQQERLNKLLIELSNDTGIPLTVTGDVHYVSNKDDWNAIRYAHRKHSKDMVSNNEFMTTAPVQLAETTIEIADAIETYDIQTSLHIPKPKHNRKWLKSYCYDKLKELGIDDDAHRNRLEKELNVIVDEIADYHILLYEIVQAIKNVSGAIGGRGSAVGSLVCYLLGFHEVDPLKYDLLFERFLNVERIQKAIQSEKIDTSLLPDIDLNIANDKKDAVFKTLENEYPYIAKVMTYSTLKVENKTIKKIKTKYPTSNVIDLKYNLSIHAGGIILSTEPFNEYLPVTLTKDNEIVTDCSLNEVESRGGIKYDLLGESSSKINDGITINDNEIHGLIKYLVQHPLGISQFTGYTARKYLRQNKVTTLDDLLKATAIIRTGSNESWIFQEDMMNQAVKYGISYADADYLRKPRGTEKEKEIKLQQILETMKNNGCKPHELEQFKNYHTSYSFNKSHAIAYTLESLKNAKLKKHNTALFFERKLNHAKDPITIAELFDDAIKLGVAIIPPGKEYYKLNARAVGNKLFIGTKFIKGISTKEPTDAHGKFNKVYKEYLKKSYVEKLYMIGAYDKNNTPTDIISLGFKTIPGNRIIVATISNDGYNNIWFDKSKHYKHQDVFMKGNTISDEILSQYESVIEYQ